DLSAPGRGRLRRAGRVGVRAGRSGGGPDRRSRGPAGAHGNRHPEEEVMTKLRFAGPIALVVVAASIAAASAQTQTLQGHGRKGSPGLELTYTKWFAPGYPNMVGVVGGDIVGTFGGAVYEKTGPDPGGLVHITAVYIVIAPDPTQSFTAHVEGIE